MYLLKKSFLFSFLFFSLVSSRCLQAQVSDYYTNVRVDWHLAGISESRQDWSGAIPYYKKVISDCQPLLLDSREWYIGTASYGIARCAARIGDTSASRLSLARALSHHFWNFSLVQVDVPILKICGEQWVDSLITFWGSVLDQERSTWQFQPTIMFYPDGYDSTSRWPLVVALHGGNECYESFAEQWKDMANRLRSVVAVPPGVVRESQITNSWGTETSKVEKEIVELVRRLTKEHLVDPAQVYLTGFSQGAESSVELALRRPEVFRGAISMSGFIADSITDSTLAVAKAHVVRIYAITGAYEDPGFRSRIDLAHDKCLRAGIAFNLDIVPGMTHEVPLDFRSQFLSAWDWVRPGSQASGGKEEREYLR
jgi:predicted esterase